MQIVLKWPVEELIENESTCAGLCILRLPGPTREGARPAGPRFPGQSSSPWRSRLVSRFFIPFADFLHITYALLIITPCATSDILVHEMFWYLRGGRCDLKFQLELQLDQSKTYTFGRDKQLEVFALVSRIASRKHFTLSFTNGNWCIIDHESSNGTLVNGEKILPNTSHVLNLNDEITIGLRELNEDSTRFYWKITDEIPVESDENTQNIDMTQVLPKCFMPKVSVARVSDSLNACGLDSTLEGQPGSSASTTGAKSINTSKKQDVIAISSDSDSDESRRPNRAGSIYFKKRFSHDDGDEVHIIPPLKASAVIKPSSQVEKATTNNKVTMKRGATASSTATNGEASTNEVNTKKFKMSPSSDDGSGDRVRKESESHNSSVPSQSTNLTCPSNELATGVPVAKNHEEPSFSCASSSKNAQVTSSVTKSSQMIGNMTKESSDFTSRGRDPCEPVAIGRQNQIKAADVHRYVRTLNRAKAGPASKVNKLTVDSRREVSAHLTTKANSSGQAGRAITYPKTSDQNENEPVIPCKPRVSHFQQRREEEEKRVREREEKDTPITGTPLAPAPIQVKSNSALLKDTLPSTSTTRIDGRPFDNRTNSHAKSTSHQKPFRVDVTNFIHRIVHWRVEWFEESKRKEELRDKEPVLANREPSKLPHTFSSYEEYFDAYSTYILYEIWAEIKQSYDENYTPYGAKSDADFRRFGHFEMYTEMYETVPKKESLMSVTLEMPITSENNLVGEGDLVVIRLTHDLVVASPGSEEDGSRQGDYLLMGYVCSSSIDANPRTLNDKAYSSALGGRTFGKVLKLQVQTKNRNIRINRKRPVRVFKLSYIKPSLRHLEALQYLKRSPLLTEILKPRIMSCKLTFPSSCRPIENYNISQTQAILGSQEIVNRPASLPRIGLIRGPPGTGKTHTLIGILTELFKKWDCDKNGRLRVLVCAPSNGAIDEIGRRLHASRSIGEKRKLRLVRIGNEDQISSDCAGFSLEQLLKNNLNNQSSEDEQNVKRLENEIQDLDQKVADLRYNGKTVEAEVTSKDIEHKHKELTRLQKKMTTVSLHTDSNKHRTRSELILKADIILSTLNSCRVSPMDSLFIDGKEMLNCVIVDEASQCTEPELIQPLVFKSVSKIILIGDPAQLPATVLSKTSVSGKFGRSLFARIDEHFLSVGGEHPVHMLKTQYRMHKEICSFPSAVFYDNLLESDTAQDTPIGIHPYTILDMKIGSVEQKDRKNIYNLEEVDLVSLLCQLATTKMTTNGGTIGIITGYRGQKRKIEEKLKKISLPTNIKCNVNTIDGFQGQERDVVILSTVRTGGSVGFMNSRERVNVALTRAKYALIVILSRTCMQKDPLWDKLIKDAQDRARIKEITREDLRMDHLKSLLTKG